MKAWPSIAGGFSRRQQKETASPGRMRRLQSFNRRGRTESGKRQEALRTRSSKPVNMPVNGSEAERFRCPSRSQAAGLDVEDQQLLCNEIGSTHLGLSRSSGTFLAVASPHENQPCPCLAHVRPKGRLRGSHRVGCHRPGDSRNRDRAIRSIGLSRVRPGISGQSERAFATAARPLGPDPQRGGPRSPGHRAGVFIPIMAQGTSAIRRSR
jgi:hypothetical protein